MNKLRVIDLLNKIANGEKVPKKIKYRGYIYELEEGLYYREDGENITLRSAFHYLYLERCLNDEVEIIEEDKKIEKIDLSEWAEITYQEDWEMLTKDFNRNCNLFVNKINEIIDYLEENK